MHKIFVGHECSAASACGWAGIKNGELLRLAEGLFDVFVTADQNINHWLDINAFSRAPRGTWGNCGIGVARAPIYKNLDAALSKRFNAGGERHFEFRAEAFNLTNTPSFSPPARDINAPNTFGTITGTVSTARTVELVLKFFF